jgi:CheY-like chemotaxis protein
MADDSPGVLLRVRDSGVGMDEETLAKATEPFFSTKEEGKGTGLGLAMVKKMAELQGGTLTIESRPGLGSSFDLHLPAWTEGDSEVTQVARETASGGRILVVDDDSAVRRVLEQALEMDGHRVVTMSSPGEAAAVLDGGFCFDLLITDGASENEDAPPLPRKFMSRCPDSKVLIYSGYSREHLEERGFAAEEKMVLARKPLPSEELRKMVAALLRRTSP